MTTAAKVILFIFLIPLLLAVGNDVYINYLSDDRKIREVKSLQINPEDFMFSDAGWVWQHYSSASMKTAHDALGEETWDQSIDPLLGQKTIYLGLIPFLSALVFLVFTFVVGVWPFSRFGKKQKDAANNYSGLKGDKEKKYKYSKK